MKDGSTAIKITLIFSALAMIAAVPLGYFLTRAILRPLRETVKIAENIAAGDLRTAIHVITSTDETRQLMQALKNMNETC